MLARNENDRDGSRFILHRHPRKYSRASSPLCPPSQPLFLIASSPENILLNSLPAQLCYPFRLPVRVSNLFHSPHLLQGPLRINRSRPASGYHSLSTRLSCLGKILTVPFCNSPFSNLPILFYF